MPAVSQLSQLLKQAAREAGFELAGVSPAADFPELAEFPAWLAAGYAGEMGYMASRTAGGELKRADVRHHVPWARSIVVCALNYNSAAPLSTEVRDPQRGWISRYAWSREDYHHAVLARLKKVEAALLAATPVARTLCYVDTGPILERVYARYAGIGWVGKNTCVINQQAGSWLFLGLIVTSLDLTPDMPAPDRCGTCRRCLDACPTEAFVAPRQLDATRCISYLTIEKRGAVPEDLRAGVGNHLFGCDICQDVCPWNQRAPVGAAEELQPRAELVHPALEPLATITEEDFREVFRGSPIKRAKRTGLRRNAVIAMGNSGDARFVPVLEELARDEDEIVAEHARWAVERLRQATPAG